MAGQPPLRIPVRWVLLNFGGALMTAAGMWRLQQEDVSQWPAGIALAAGLLLMATSLLQILKRARCARPGAPG